MISASYIRVQIEGIRVGFCPFFHMSYLFLFLISGKPRRVDHSMFFL